jgi:hypothetical protein
MANFSLSDRCFFVSQYFFHVHLNILDKVVSTVYFLIKEPGPVDLGL